MAEAGPEHSDEHLHAANNASDSKTSSSHSVNDSDDSPVTENDSFLFFSYLEEIDDRIEHLRRHALALSQERDSLLLVLSQLKEESMTGSLHKDEFQEICVNMDRLRMRCQAVDIKVHVIRSPGQEDAYLKVCTLVDELEQSFSSSTLNDKREVIKRAKTYLNACSSDLVGGGAIDFKFQGMILDCVMEDQKYIRFRLENIVNNSIRPSEHSERSPTIDTGGDYSENCVKPSAISSAVKDNPHFDEFCDTEESTMSPIAGTEGVGQSNSEDSYDNRHHSNDIATSLGNASITSPDRNFKSGEGVDNTASKSPSKSPLYES